MIDPFTAFTMAQTAVKGIKSAIALGKDVQSIMGDISEFYYAADMLQYGANKARINGIRKSDADINKEAFDLAWKAKQIWEEEKAIKSHLFLTGNRDVWENMMAERTRLSKERAELERMEQEQKQKDREAIGNTIMNLLLFISGAACLIPFSALAWQLWVVK
jgi:hypothetical protein